MSLIGDFGDKIHSSCVEMYDTTLGKHKVFINGDFAVSPVVVCECLLSIDNVDFQGVKVDDTAVPTKIP